MLDPELCHRALAAGDVRFDGLFFVGITTTGIYCRPVCPARKAARRSRRFFPSAAAAEEAGFRPCLRCRPELAPGLSPYEQRWAQAAALVARLQAGAVDGETSLNGFAAANGMSDRQLRRVVREATGVSPGELVRTARLLLAKQLLTETTLPVTQVAFASGFQSLRRFHEAFAGAYRMPPGRFRKDGTRGRAGPVIRLRLAYRPPFPWPDLLAFFAARTIAGVEEVEGDRYRRTVALGDRVGWFEVGPARRGAHLVVTVTTSLGPVLQQLLARIRELFDLNLRPDVVDDHLSRSPVLAALVARRPGLRVPGAFEGFEVAWRAVLGQQVSVGAATTLAGRFAERFGRPVETPHGALCRLTPTAETVAAASEDDVAGIGLPGARARTVLALARICAEEPWLLAPGTSPELARERLLALPGVGPWTVEYLLMRALHWPDAFPETDLGIKKAMEGLGVEDARTVTETWRPWRSHAARYLWSGLADPKEPAKTRPRLVATKIKTPLGTMHAWARDEGICLLEFEDRKGLGKTTAKIQEELAAEAVAGKHEHLQRLADELRRYFAGDLERFTVPLAPVGGAFARKVWRALRRIPYGRTRSYAWLAKAVGSPGAARAVGTANGRNPIAIVVPCHRVIRADGQLGGYGGGLWRKRRLLGGEQCGWQAARIASPRA